MSQYIPIIASQLLGHPLNCWQTARARRTYSNTFASEIMILLVQELSQ